MALLCNLAQTMLGEFAYRKNETLLCMKGKATYQELAARSRSPAPLGSGEPRLNFDYLPGPCGAGCRLTIMRMRSCVIRIWHRSGSGPTLQVSSRICIHATWS